MHVKWLLLHVNYQLSVSLAPILDELLPSSSTATYPSLAPGNDSSDRVAAFCIGTTRDLRVFDDEDDEEYLPIADDSGGYGAVMPSGIGGGTSSRYGSGSNALGRP